MIEYKIDKDGDSANISFNGNIMDLVQESAFMVKEVYSGLKTKDEDAADIYKRAMMLCIKEDNSPVWE